MIRLFTLLLALCMGCVVQAAEKPKVLMLASSKIMAKTKLLERLAERQPFELLVLTRTDDMTDEALAEHWAKADLVLLDGINPVLSNAMFERHQPLLKQFPDVPVVALGNPGSATLNQGLQPKQQETLEAYSRNAGRINYQNMLTYLASEIL